MLRDLKHLDKQTPNGRSSKQWQGERQTGKADNRAERYVIGVSVKRFTNPTHVTESKKDSLWLQEAQLAPVHIILWNKLLCALFPSS